MHPRNLQAQWARLLVATLAEAGVRDVVISPGSRSTPFVLAAVEQRDLSCIDIVDERSAAFFALGQARVAGRPTLLIATSGTAGANYFPAVCEAGASHVPLLVLTADRPPELHACGANQTLDQVKLFGSHTRAFFDLGTPDAAPVALRALRRKAVQAVHASLAPRAGAVHLNAAARKPLEPGAADSTAERDLVSAVDELLRRPAPRALTARHMAEPADIEELAKACRKARRGLIVCGPAPKSRAGVRSLVAELARRTGFPVLREAASQMRYCPELSTPDITTVDAFDVLLKSDWGRSLERPDLILQLGRVPTSGGWGAWLAKNANVSHWVLGAEDWHDSESTASHLLFSDLDSCLARLTTRLPTGRAPSPWAITWRQGEERAQSATADLLVAEEGLSEGGVARRLVEALPGGGLLVLGNSLAIRQVDTWGRSAKDLRVICQRGASGIDGVTSGAIGAATRWRFPVALLVGDLSFLHDLTALQAARYVAVPLVIVVVQNRGGRIFEQLPLASHEAAKDDVFEHWTTPHELDFAAAAAMAGLAFERVATQDELVAALDKAFTWPSVSVVEAVVPPHGAAEQAQRLRDQLDAMDAADPA